MSGILDIKTAIVTAISGFGSRCRQVGTPKEGALMEGVPSGRRVIRCEACGHHLMDAERERYTIDVRMTVTLSSKDGRVRTSLKCGGCRKPVSKQNIKVWITEDIWQV